ncbi:acyl-CoA dehydrogenase family protein [Halorarum salinum]|uniref:Acyl-CoA dehydrogenase family protein n=1 Tax=Halorarum salinum TaxID=2743089 RepID=A0A7D5LCR9_9EURY|nr:acyl-CoA dehydrogenase family protein [Halobaculum salinum]QLG63511.1 acyl-CoA dehydrogenase family protein [Halobaculum salinum]
MDVRYDDGEAARELAARTREFLDEEVIPVEREVLGGDPVTGEQVADLRAAAREYDVYCPQIGEEFGGMGVDFRDALPMFEAAGRSLLGPLACRVDAPDEGNMHTLELLGTDDQREEYLRPLVAGEVSSGFSMTEPMQGGGSDPKMLKTAARKDGDEWVVDGHKWWTTGGTEADFLIVMARTDPDAHPYEGCSLFLVDADADGVAVERDIPHLGGGVTGTGHAEIVFEGVRVPEGNLLGERNEGFQHAQQRLGPARLTHCMRYSGMAERALDVAKAYATEREGFGGPLAEKQSLRYDVADAETRLHAVRTTVRDAADRIARGDEARVQVSMSKTFAANVVQDVVDTCLQACGANGIGKDLPISDFYEAVRQFRLVDGADEVHKRVVAREAFADVDPDELANVTRYDG